MKLNKNICKECHNHNRKSGDWDEVCEYWWEGRKKVLCAKYFERGDLTGSFSIRKMPDRCIYKLEHIVLDETK